MSVRYFEDYTVGEVFETVGRTVTETDIILFCSMTGDNNPLHTDEEFAKTTRFGTRIANGPLTLALALGLVSRLGLTEGTALAFLGLEWRFLAPVKAGDTIRVRMRVADLVPTSKLDRGILVRKIEVLTQSGAITQEGITKTLIRRREEPAPPNRHAGDGAS